MPRYSRLLSLRSRPVLYNLAYAAAPNSRLGEVYFDTTAGELRASATIGELVHQADDGDITLLRWQSPTGDGFDPADIPAAEYDFELFGSSAIVIARGSFTLTDTAGPARFTSVAHRTGSRVISGFGVDLGRTPSDTILAGAVGVPGVPEIEPPYLRMSLFAKPAVYNEVDTWCRVTQSEAIVGAISVIAGDTQTSTVTVECPYDADIAPAMRAVLDGARYQVANVNIVRPYHTLALELVASV